MSERLDELKRLMRRCQLCGYEIPRINVDRALYEEMCLVVSGQNESLGVVTSPVMELRLYGIPVEPKLDSLTALQQENAELRERQRELYAYIERLGGEVPC